MQVSTNLQIFEDYFAHQGNVLITGSRDATREAFKMGLIQDGEPWMEMINSLNQTSHTYNKSVAEEIVSKIKNQYFQLFSDFKDTMTELKK